MKPMILGPLVAALLAADLGLAAAESSNTSALVSPVQKVIEMLNGMLTKGKQEKHAEQIQFATYKQFCVGTIAEKTNDVQEADDEIEQLKANIQMAETDATNYGKKVDSLNADIATWTADQKAATKARELDRNEYMAAHKEYSETIDAVSRAYQVLQAMLAQGNKAQAKPAVSLLMGMKGLDRAPEARPVLAAFLADAAEQSPPASPEAYAYEFRSSNVLDMLQKLKDKFIDERTALEKEEMNSRHAHELQMQDTKKSITAAEDGVSQKVQQKAKQLQSSASMKGQLDDATSDRTTDQKYLTEVSATCKQKEGDYKERQKMRAEEIVAIEKALELLKGCLEGMCQTTLLQLRRRRGVALAQARVLNQSPTQLLVAQYLNRRADHLNSHALSALAVHAREDPFSKVKKMIQDLIMRLMEEAGEEASHKSWCDAELASNKKARDARSVDVNRLNGEIDNLEASIAQLGLELGELAKQVASTDQQMADQTKIRTSEKAENEQIIKDAKEAQAAIGQAVTVLKEFYARAAEATALVQRRRQTPTAPPIFDSPYTGMGAENGGVIAMLEVIQSDYAGLESSTRASEVTAQQDYDKQVTDNKVLKAQLTTDRQHKTRLKQTYEQSLGDRRNDLNSAQKELDAANNYYEKLKPSCLDAGVSFEERNQRRKEEIESLQEALRILNGEDIS